jgi:hypothetical protein
LTTLHLVSAKNTNSWCTRKGDLQCATPLDILTASSSSIAITADDEHLASGGFSLGEPGHIRNFEFITDYFDGLSLSPRSSNEGTIFVGSTRSRASTPQRAMVEDSTEEFLIASSGQGSLGHPSPRRRSMGASFATTTAATWKENAPAMTRFPPENNHPSERHHTHHEGQPTQARPQHPTAEPELVS